MSSGGNTGGQAWSEYDDIYLRDNWGKMPASKIGADLGGRSKNSVLGRAHRLGLDHLISPPFRQLKPVSLDKRATQKREYERRRSAARKAGMPFTKQERQEVIVQPTLSALPSLIALANEPFKHEVAPMPPPPKEPPPVPRSARVVLGAMSQCCWPIGDPKAADFKYCCEPVGLGRSYCPKHHKIAYAPRQREAVG